MTSRSDSPDPDRHDADLNNAGVTEPIDGDGVEYEVSYGDDAAAKNAGGAGDGSPVDPAPLDPASVNPAPIDPVAPAAAAAKRGFPLWAQLALLGVAIAVVIGFVFIPQFKPDDPLDAIGPADSPARQVAASLEGQLTCNGGQVSDDRAVLACFAQDDQRVSIVFLQSNLQGQVASYTVETLPLSETPDTGQTIALANQVAGIVSPGENFNTCGMDRTQPFFCFGSLAVWESADLEAVQTTGEKRRMPTLDELDDALNTTGWSCDFGICSKGTETITAQQPLTGLGLQYSTIDVAEVKATATAFVGTVDNAPDLAEWVGTLDGKINIVVRDRLVAGFLPQLGGGGLFLIDEVAGVIPDQA